MEESDHDNKAVIQIACSRMTNDRDNIGTSFRCEVECRGDDVEMLPPNQSFIFDGGRDRDERQTDDRRT